MVFWHHFEESLLSFHQMNQYYLTFLLSSSLVNRLSIISKVFNTFTSSITNGGNNLIIFLPEYNIRSPSLIPSNNISLISNNPFLKMLPTLTALPTRFSSTIESIVAIPAEHESGFPAKVEECSPSFIASSISGLDRVKPIGNPPAIPLARHIISGIVDQCSLAHILPVLPNPVCISSKINTRLLWSQIFLIF